MFESPSIQRDINVTGKDPQEVVGILLSRFRAINLSPLFRSFNVDLQDLSRLYFESETGPDGTAWPELSPATIEAKGHGQILLDESDLMESLVGMDHPDSIRDMIIETNQQSMSFGTGSEYSAYHQEGTANLPIREHVGVSDEVVDAMSEQTADHIIGVMIEGVL